MMFAVIMGIGGLTLVYEQNDFCFFLSNICCYGNTSCYCLYLLVLFFYILKIIRFKEEVKKLSPIRVNFFAAFFYFYAYLYNRFQSFFYRNLGILFYYGALFHIFFTYYTNRYDNNNMLKCNTRIQACIYPIVEI